MELNKGGLMRHFLMLFFSCALFLSSTAVFAEAKDATILLAFGTSDPEAKQSLDAIGAAYKKRGKDVMWVYSSNIIRKKLNDQGEEVFSIDEALDEAHKRGYKNLEIQSLHVAPAEEYMKVNRLIARSMERNPDRFDSVVFGQPLLMSKKDLDITVAAVQKVLAQKRKPGEAVVLMGHGNNRGTGDILFVGVNQAFQSVDPLIWVANVEGATPFTRMPALLKEAGVKKVWLMPLMIVAGDHAKNDMAGPEADSWTTILKKEGFQVESIVQGLGGLEEIQNLFIEHTDNAYDDIKNGTIITK